jgi:Putative zinc-finger
MRCRRVERLLSKHLEGRLPARAAAAVAAHLGACLACRRLRDEFHALGADLREPLDLQPGSDFDRRAIDRWLAEGRPVVALPRQGRGLASALLSRVRRAPRRERRSLFLRAGLALVPLAVGIVLFLGSGHVRTPGRQGPMAVTSLAGRTTRYSSTGNTARTLSGRSDARSLGPANEFAATKAQSPPSRAEESVREGGLRAVPARGFNRRVVGPGSVLAHGFDHGDQPGAPAFPTVVSTDGAGTGTLSPRHHGGSPARQSPAGTRNYVASADPDLAYMNVSPAVSFRRWAELPPDEAASLDARLRRAAGGDDFVTVPLPRIAAEGPAAERAAAEAVAAYKRETAVVDSRLFHKVILALKATSLADLCERLRADTGIQLAAGQSVADEKVTVFCKETPLRDVMRQLSRPFGYAWLRSGKPSEYKYELVQDLRSQLLEEDLRNRDRNAALLALDREMQRYRPYLSMTPDEALARAKGTSPAEKALLEKLAGKSWGAIQMYFRLSPNDLTALRAGQKVTYSVDPQPGEQPLPAEVARAALQSWRDWRGRKKDDGFEDAPEKDLPDGLPLTSFAETRARVTLRIDHSELGVFRLDGGSGYLLGGHSSVISNDIAQGMSPAVAQPENETANAKLARDPALRARVTVRPRPSCVGNLSPLPPPRSGEGESSGIPAAYAKPGLPSPLRGGAGGEVNPAPRVTTADVLEALHEASGLPIVADYYTRLYSPTELAVQNMPLFDALNRLANTMRLRWDRDPEGGWVQFRSASFFNDRIKEVPNQLLSRWAASRQQHGALTLDDLIDIAQLSDPQLDSAAMMEGAKLCWGLGEWGLARRDAGLRRHLRYLAAFTPDQLRLAQTGEGLAFTRMTLAQQQGFIALGLTSDAFRSNVDQPSPGLEALSNATLRIDYTLPGGFEWVKPQQPDAPSWQALLPSPARERTREAALIAAQRVDRQVDPGQIAPTELGLTLFYAMGSADTGRATTAVRATPKSTRIIRDTVDATGKHHSTSDGITSD